MSPSSAVKFLELVDKVVHSLSHSQGSSEDGESMISWPPLVPQFVYLFACFHVMSNSCDALAFPSQICIILGWEISLQPWKMWKASVFMAEGSEKLTLGLVAHDGFWNVQPTAL